MFRSVSAVLVSLIFLSSVTFAQSGPSIVTGLVKYESGGIIPGATIHVVNEATGRAVDLFSDEQGAYQAPALEPGPYRDETTLDGFEPVVRRVVFGAGQKNSNDVVLSPARFSQLDEDYFDLLSAAPGNTGLYVGQPGDGRTVGVTLRVSLRSK